MTTLLLHVKILEPLLFQAVGNGDENSARTLPYIPGSAVRGALASRHSLARSGGDLAGDAGARRLFFSGEVRYLNGYPAVNGKRSLPMPASLRQPKYNPDDAFPALDAALAPEEVLALKSPVPLPAPFGWIVETGIQHLQPAQVLNLHIGGEGRGAVKKGQSFIFQYEAIEAGQEMVIPILCDDPGLVNALRALVEQDRTLTFGRSRSAGYGAARVETLTLLESWAEAPAGDPDDVLTLTLLSDAILRDEFGQPTHNPLPALERRLERSLEPGGVRVFSRPGIVGGFNRKWRLPTTQFSVLGMGSVIILPEGLLTEAEVEKLMKQGIGERRVEGFGRLAANWPGQSNLPRAAAMPAHPLPPPALSPRSRLLAAAMSERLYRLELEKNLAREVPRWELRGSLSNHLLSRLRQQLRRAIASGQGVEGILAFLDDLKPAAQAPLRRARIIRWGSREGDRFWEWMEQRLRAMDGVSQLGNPVLPVVAGEQAQPNPALHQYFTLRLLEALIDSKMKHNRKEVAV